MLELISGGPSNLFTAPSVDAGRVLVSLVVLSMGAFLSLRGASHIPKTYFPPSPVKITSRTEKGVEEISLRKFVEKKCPSLRSPFVPAWWLFSGHLQTLYCVAGDFSKIDKVVYHREFLRLMDGGTLGLDFTPTNSDQFKPETPLIVVMHGLTGGSYESYVRSILYPACTPIAEGGLGFRAVVVNFRGCAGTPITSARLYSGAHTDDLRQALFYISTLYPKAPLLGIGFSLGANVMTRYLSEEGINSRLRSGCILGCPWDLKKNNERLISTFIGRHVYSKGMGGNLQKLLRRHAAALSGYPHEVMSERVHATLALKKPFLHEVDHSWTRWVGGTSPPFPFGSAEEYYEYGSSHLGLGEIKVPFITINAADDPVVQSVPLDTVRNGWGTMVMTGGGGHLGWFEVGDRIGEVRRWVRKPVLEWLRAIGEDMVHAEKRGLPLHEVDGFLKEVGRDDLGCRKIDDEVGFVVGNEGQEGLLSGL